MSIAETSDGVILTIFVKPNSAKFKIALDGDEIIVHSTEEPVKGKVNKEIIKELTNFLHIKVELVSGVTSRKKQFFIKGMGKQQLEKLFQLKPI